MAEAGASPVISVNTNETAFIVKKELSLKSIIRIIQFISEETLKEKIIENTKMEGLREKSCDFIKTSSNIKYILAEGYYDGNSPLVICLNSINDIYGIFDLIFKKDNPHEIFNSIFCFSGSILRNCDVKREFDENIIKKEIDQKIVKYFEQYKIKESIKMIKKLKNIPLINILENSAKLIETYEIFKFKSKT